MSHVINIGSRCIKCSIHVGHLCLDHLQQNEYLCIGLILESEYDEKNYEGDLFCMELQCTRI